MSRPLVTYPSAVNATVDVLRAVGVNARGSLPADWTTSSTPVITVHLDGGGWLQGLTPIAVVPTVRLVAWSGSPTVSHDLVMLAAGHLEAHDGAQLFARILNGPIEAVDPDHGDARLCAVTLRVRVRSMAVT